MSKRIAITGPESSGKTTIAKDLASYFKTSFAPEYAREFLTKNQNYTQTDLDLIAKGQLAEIKKIESNEIVIADTEMLVMKIWSLVVFKTVSEFIETSFQTQKFDLYLLCSPDIPWEYDPLRVDKNNREMLFKLYQDELVAKNLPFVILTGNKNQRISAALHAISSIK